MLYYIDERRGRKFTSKTSRLSASRKEEPFSSAASMMEMAEAVSRFIRQSLAPVKSMCVSEG